MNLDIEFMQETLPLVTQGIGVTMKLTLLSLLLASPFAFYFALARLKEVPLISRGVRAYVSFVRGTPVILQILLLYSLLPSLLNGAVQALGLEVDVFEAVDPFYYAVLIFTLNTIALLTEVFRSALGSVGHSQMEAGLAAGLTEGQTYRHIIIPQAIVVALPALCNLTVNLIKGTSLAFLMTVKDIMAIGKIAASYGYNYLEAYLDVFIVYIVLCTVMQLLFQYLEQKMGSYRLAS